MTAYVNQYNSYPPHAPYPTYMASETINGVTTGGWDPNIGFIMTHGMGLEPPSRDTVTGHFKWYGVSFDSLPDVCKCPSMSPALLDPTNPEVDPSSLETSLYNYALSYQTSGTCRSATKVVKERTKFAPGVGGRNPTVPDPTSVLSQRPTDNTYYGTPNVYVNQHSGAVDSNTFGVEVNCYLQAVSPAEVQSPGRVYYLADSRDYRPYENGWPPAGKNSSWMAGYGNHHFLGSRHFGYGNVMYLDGRVNRDNQMHLAMFNMDYYAGPPEQLRSSQWRAATFADDIPLAGIGGQMHIMPVLMVKGWEYFFDANGLKAK